jgi:broad specificity phosphatase PhoE
MRSIAEHTTRLQRPQQRFLRFVRHGATMPNVAGLACGGDLDAALIDAGREQAAQIGQRVAAMQPPVGLIVTSDLRRTRETAAIVASSLPGVEVLIEPAFGERLLGQWNMRPTEKTRPWLASGMEPPGGETEEEFVGRIDGAVRRLWPYLEQRPLLVGSRGVARAIGVLLDMPGRVDLSNGALIEFDMSAFECQPTVWDEL